MESTRAMNPQTYCRLLSLPPEIRSRIFTYALKNQASQVWLDDASEKKPSKNLLLTCQSIQAELNSMYTKMYRDYWTKTVFKICPIGSSGPPKVKGIDHADLERITCIRFIVGHEQNSRPIAQFNFDVVPSPEYPWESTSSHPDGLLPWKIKLNTGPVDFRTLMFLLNMEYCRLRDIGPVLEALGNGHDASMHRSDLETIVKVAWTGM